MFLLTRNLERFVPSILLRMDARKILIGVTGGIAAYKAPGVIRRLGEAGYEVRVLATEAAFRFVPEETLAVAAGEPVYTDETWWERSGRVEHVSLARWADLVLVAPATADSMVHRPISMGSWVMAPAMRPLLMASIWA